MANPQLPRLAVTMGDAAGVGPEVIAGCWGDERVFRVCRPIVIGHPEVLRRAGRLVGAPFEVVSIKTPQEADDLPQDSSTMPCLAAPFSEKSADSLLNVPPGTNDPRTGEAAYQAIRLAAELVLSGQIDGMVTAPISKTALHLAGHDYPGHTELLAELCNAPQFAMMLYLPPGVANRSPAGLGVAHVTLHMALRDIFAAITTGAVVEKCQLAHDMMRRLGCESPRVGVAALNPHGGEEGLFGDEEIQILGPAVEQAKQAGMDATGPFPADTLMIAARDGQFDAVVAQYHDQGHIALKLLAMHAAVNVTLGLPIVRTSVAHGTAFDRAWKGTAETTGMIAAIETAAKLANTE